VPAQLLGDRLDLSLSRPLARTSRPAPPPALFPSEGKRSNGSVEKRPARSRGTSGSSVPTRLRSRALVVAAAIAKPKRCALALRRSNGLRHLRFQSRMDLTLNRRSEEVLVALQKSFEVDDLGLTFKLSHGVHPSTGLVTSKITRIP
jgi:hypothetical protein